MSLLQACISKMSTILVEHSNSDRDFSAAVQSILDKIPPNNSKLTYVWEQYLIHYISENGVVYLVMADDSVGRRMPFAFLADLQRQFTSSSYSESLNSANHYSLGEFEPTLAKLMKQYSTEPPPDALKQAQADLGNVKDIMVNNIDAILSRGERIELLVDKTDTMATQAWAFKRSARGVRRKMWWKNTKIMILSSFVVVFLIYLLVAQFCGLSLTRCGGTRSGSDP
ncbi:vamp synaptobrevin-like protein [Phaffia rhodozyma]|uniref:Synaptobrevin homolog YKT6 n=1 Tax=Phaffia rhodozyma TaxID=264483 RepID=A0A0F7SUB4_PHARH|nr:vamp synaptobrevin-like protein [Phaffia rhodozyma]